MEKVITLKGRISSDNAAQVEQQVFGEISKDVTSLIIDAGELQYISSAGLRIILRLRKEIDDVRIINCNPEVFDILAVTGFNKMMDVSKPYQEVSIEGLKQIGTGFYGIVYRLDNERIVKVYKYPDSLGMIRRERDLAQKAFLMGIPTAISFDIVKVGNLYGSVFELLDATPIADLINDDASIEDFCEKAVKLLKQIHSTKMTPGELPQRKDGLKTQIEGCKEYFSEEEYKKLLKLCDEIPETYTMIHSDFHIKNIMRHGDELLLIDMDTLSTGHPVFEFGAMYATYVAFAAVDKNNTMDFLGIPLEKSHKIWELIFKKYYGEKATPEVEKKIAVIAYLEVLYLRSKFGDHSNKIVQEEIKHSADFVKKALSEIDSLYY